MLGGLEFALKGFYAWRGNGAALYAGIFLALPSVCIFAHSVPLTFSG
jgi:hypothetical protein